MAASPAPVHLAACCCIQCPGEREKSPVKVGGPGDATSPERPAPYFTCGFFTVGKCHFHQLLQCIQDISSLSNLLSFAKPSSPREEILRGQTWNSGQGLESTETIPQNVRCVQGLSPA